ncbi:dentin sialophospho isoform x1 [Lasius niger]|uniref:Dentin sialophospho isoform x1 n=1 Tax=Lasius niger TaxID=67767 RepID=A0A0J7K471_LASNI|nr:dentin sialophospho isoform x1 [Lasius niger]
MCSVHEDRVDEERRGASGGGGEVAGLEDVDDSCVATVTSSVPGAGGIRSHRRTRPLSLAVQPLNYHRLDPDSRPSAATIGARHHANMTSQESIGSCSLDVDRSASDRSGWLSTH